jgi:hypothetical protein
MQVDATKLEMFVGQYHVLWDGLYQIAGYCTMLGLLRVRARARARARARVRVSGLRHDARSAHRLTPHPNPRPDPTLSLPTLTLALN